MTDLAEFLLARLAATASAWAEPSGEASDAHREFVLADCDAKRRIVERISDVKGWTGSYAVRDVVLELLALPYADHPDYRQGWRP